MSVSRTSAAHLDLTPCALTTRHAVRCSGLKTEILDAITLNSGRQGALT